MDGSYQGVDWRRVVIGGVIPSLVFAILCAATDAVQIIPPLNLVVIALAFTITVAFLPNFFRAIEKGRPLDTEGMVCIGISFAWLGYASKGALALVYRLFPDMRWIIDSDVNSWILFMTIYAAAMHIGAPAIDRGMIPSARWARIGGIAGAGMFAGMCILYWPEVFHVWTHAPSIQMGLHDHFDFAPRPPPMSH